MRKLSLKKKGLALVLSTGLVGAVTIGGTLAWLTDDTGALTNNFEPSKVNVILTENELQMDGGYFALDDDGNPVLATGNPTVILGDEDTGNDGPVDLPLTPGSTVPKNPQVKVEAGSEKCWVFLEVKEYLPEGALNSEGNPGEFEDYIRYTIAPGNWTKIADATTEADTTIYYKIFEDNLHLGSVVLKNNEVKIPKTVTSKMLASLGESDTTDVGTVTLSFEASAIQYNHLDYGSTTTEVEMAKIAWNELNSTT